MVVDDEGLVCSMRVGRGMKGVFESGSTGCSRRTRRRTERLQEGVGIDQGL